MGLGRIEAANLANEAARPGRDGPTGDSSPAGPVRAAGAGAGLVGQRFRFGDLVLVTGSLRAIEPANNPGQPDYAGWAARRGIFVQIRATRVEIAAPGDAPWNILRFASEVRDRAAGLVGRGLARSDAALAGSLLFGSGGVPVDPRTRQVFVDLGLAHILAASGMQTTLLVGLALGIGRVAQVPPVPRCLAAGLLATFFAAMCGFSASILRATWMSAAALVAEASGRQATGTRTLWLSAFAMIVASPAVVLDIGFLFSFLATYGLLTTGASLRRALLGLVVGAFAGSAPQGKPGPRRVSGESGLPGSSGVPGASGVPWPDGREAHGGGTRTIPGPSAAPDHPVPCSASGGNAVPDWQGQNAASDRGRGEVPAWAAILVDGVTAPIAAFVWCVPLQVALFGRLSLWSLPANWYAEGFVVLLTHAGFILAGGGLFWEALALPAPWILGPLLGALQSGLAAIHSWPGADLSVPSPPLWSAGLAYASLALFGASGTWRRAALPHVAQRDGGPPPGGDLLDTSTCRSATDQAASRARGASGVRAGVAGVGLASGILVIGGAAGHTRPHGLEVTILDVGQGDAIVVRSPDGGCQLVDAGPASAGWDAGTAIVLPALARFGCRGLDLAVATHPHADHIGGMASVLGAMPVREIWDSGQADGSPGLRALLATALGTGTPIAVPGCGMRRMLGGVEWLVLRPPHALSGTRSDANNNGVVVRLRYGSTRVLLAADLEAEGEQSLLESLAASELAAELFKVPHHGSRFGTTAPFLAMVRPRASIVSAGRENRFGHPDPATLSRLSAFGPVYRTDRDGAIVLRIDGDGWQVLPWRKEPRFLAARPVAAGKRERHDVAP